MENLFHKLILHILTRLNERPTNDYQAVKQIGINPALFLFKVTADLEPIATLQGTDSKGVLGGDVADMSYSLGHMRKLFTGIGRLRGLKKCPINNK